jgi:hypothetical protein
MCLRHPDSLFTFDLSTRMPASTAATEALTELTEQLEVHIGACPLTVVRHALVVLLTAAASLLLPAVLHCAAEGRLDVALQTLERATRYLAAAQREQEEAVRLAIARAHTQHRGIAAPTPLRATL